LFGQPEPQPVGILLRTLAGRDVLVAGRV
jgi:hypothetical protein